ncbi:hypothetical protein PLICRDRAFT_32220 [Plicaturopsis crispa FD-325 SS-3]|uniref:Uncharacterized protein n=1 Tax=Plicaturopsis crispa FD-325 SS-3 TaxID=944288 RepID=A0A0C9T579_PLICR|nr:hypothetical protein PLICRDRAFT_32220 [Plicaturopsis crispa FD-325 SS-3]
MPVLASINARMRANTKMAATTATGQEAAPLRCIISRWQDNLDAVSARQNPQIVQPQPATVLVRHRRIRHRVIALRRRRRVMTSANGAQYAVRRQDGITRFELTQKKCRHIDETNSGSCPPLPVVRLICASRPMVFCVYGIATYSMTRCIGSQKRCMDTSGVRKRRPKPPRASSPKLGRKPAVEARLWLTSQEDTKHASQRRSCTRTIRATRRPGMRRRWMCYRAFFSGPLPKTRKGPRNGKNAMGSEAGASQDRDTVPRAGKLCAWSSTPARRISAANIVSGSTTQLRARTSRSDQRPPTGHKQVMASTGIAADKLNVPARSVNLGAQVERRRGTAPTRRALHRVQCPFVVAFRGQQAPVILRKNPWFVHEDVSYHGGAVDNDDDVRRRGIIQG